MNIFDIFTSFGSAGLATAAIYSSYRFYRRHLIDFELHANSANSYCYVVDSERNKSLNKVWYFAQLKATVDISVGPGLVLEDIRMVVKDYKRYSEVEFTAPRSPEEVKDFFKPYGKEWSVIENGTFKHAETGAGPQIRLTAKGVARWYEPFSNLPNGGHEVVLIFVLKRFLVTVPCQFASMGGGEVSTICGTAKVCRKVANNIDSIALAKDVEPEPRRRDSVFRLQLAILDFDFLPGSSWFKALCMKRERIASSFKVD